MTLKESDCDRRGDWFQTFTGKKFYSLDARVEDINRFDIAHALSNICRFGGHCNQFYSVAQHSCHVSDVLGAGGYPQWAFVGLMHDATEAYMGDMVRPLKYSLPEYQNAETALWHIIALAFDLPFVMPKQVKAVDNLLLMTERRDIVRPSGNRWHESLEAIVPLDLVINPWSPDCAKEEFLSRLNRLQPIHRNIWKAQPLNSSTHQTDDSTAPL